MDTSDEDEEDFEDALEDSQSQLSVSKKNKKISNEVSLSDSLEAAREAIDKFLNNHFDEARDIVQPL